MTSEPTTSKENSSSPAPPEAVKDPQHHDVLCGRGGDVNTHRGNLLMRGYCVEVLDEYRAAKKMEKKSIAKRVVAKIRSLDPPGRFLKRDAKNGMWFDIGDEQATKKVAAALRESVPDKKVWEQQARCYGGNATTITASFAQSSSISMTGWVETSKEGYVRHVPTVSNTSLPVNDLERSSIPNDCLVVTEATNTMLPSTEEQRVSSALHEDLVSSSSWTTRKPTIDSPSSLQQISSKGHPDENTSDNNNSNLQFIFGEVFAEEMDGPVFTEEQAQRERREMTEEEKMAALVDIFGEMACEVRQPPKKKVARERRPGGGDPEQSAAALLESLLREMTAEIEVMPAEKKAALVEAMERTSSPNEFSNERMELFLRRESLNAKLAAKRFVKYWAKRRELFGADKFHLPMSLNGALRDDRVALETGTLSIVPEGDASGRLVLYYAPHRHTREGYKRESMIRAVWYVLEIAMEDSAASKGVVLLISWAGTTLWDYDRRLEQDAILMEQRFLPIRFCSLQATGANSVFHHLVKPRGFAIMTKETRARVVTTNLVGSPLLDVLETHGLARSVVPVDMGGECQYSHLEWLEKRRREGK